jgi:hypothetical protein
MDDRICHLTAQELIKALEPWERMRAAGYQSTEEFFDEHGWHLTIREIRERGGSRAKNVPKLATYCLREIRLYVF